MSVTITVLHMRILSLGGYTVSCPEKQSSLMETLEPDPRLWEKSCHINGLYVQCANRNTQDMEEAQPPFPLEVQLSDSGDFQIHLAFLRRNFLGGVS